MDKLYCYVDESGQDTFAHTGHKQLFIVAIAVLQQDRNELAEICEQYETVSGKGKFKWGQAEYTKRLRYMRLILADGRFHQALRYVIFTSITRNDFDKATIDGIVRAVLWKQSCSRFQTHVFIDGLAKSKRVEYRRRLKTKGILISEVKGVPRDESNALTRLADSLAGFVRDAVEDADSEVNALLYRALRNEEIVEV